MLVCLLINDSCMIIFLFISFAMYFHLSIFLSRCIKVTSKRTFCLRFFPNKCLIYLHLCFYLYIFLQFCLSICLCRSIEATYEELCRGTTETPVPDLEEVSCSEATLLLRRFINAFLVCLSNVLFSQVQMNFPFLPFLLLQHLNRLLKKNN